MSPRRPPSTRRTNLGLLALLLSAAATGLLAYAVGTPTAARVVVVAHGALGLTLLLLSRPKRLMVRRARTRPTNRTRSGAGAMLGVLVLLCVATGVAHALGATGPYANVTTLQVHVGAAILTAVPLLVHVVDNPTFPRASDLSRRTVLRGTAVVGGGVLAWFGLAVTATATGVPGAQRRSTGSFERGTGDPAAMPVTQWFTDTVPDVDRDHRVVVRRGSSSVEVNPADLVASTTTTALIDCTGGWFATQDWGGVTLGDLLDQSLERDDDDRWSSVDVVSVTGYRRRLPLADARTLLLATHVGGAALSAGHGGPLRLVAPGRRGFWWVKWVAEVEVVQDPWWIQPPFPLR